MTTIEENIQEKVLTNEKIIEKLGNTLFRIEEASDIQKEILSKAKQIQVIYKEILLQQHRQTDLLERLERSGKIVTVGN